jgi:hypothetical protein
MSMHRFILAFTVAALIAAVYASPSIGESPRDATASTPALRVGVFDREALLVAYYHSQIHDQELGALQADLARAKEKGDAAAMKRIEAQGEAMQDLAHRQLAGEATLTNVLAPLRPHFADVASAMHVAMIIEEPLYRDANVEIVDVTAKLVEELPPVRR